MKVESEELIVENIVTPKPIVEIEKIALSLEMTLEKPSTENHQPTTDNSQFKTQNSQLPKISALSLASIRAKKEMAENFKTNVKVETQLPSEPFTETEMQEQWMKYAQRMEDKGYRIIASLLTSNDPTLDGTTITHELANESSKIDFDKEKPELLGYLRGKLHNHDIQIQVKVNEALVSKRAYTNQDKYNRLVEINPNLAMLKDLFGLEINE